MTALVAETLVGSLEAFAENVGLSDFFVAAVIVAIVGNAAEHGGAVIVAYRGKIKLAAEIALSLAVVMVTIWGGRSSRLRGGILVAAYIGVAALFFIVGDG